MRKGPLPIGKLPPDLLARLLAAIPINDERVVVGPGCGLDCAVIEMGDRLLVAKSDPVTFASDAIGWYAVQVNANDIATSGAMPRWFLASCLLPEGTGVTEIESIAKQLKQACAGLGVSLVGGHTEITHGIDHPIICGTMFGETEREHLVTPRGALPGDHILLSGGIPIEATALLAREFPQRIRKILGGVKLGQAARYLYNPGIGVLHAARLAVSAGRVHAMHDPTEGGLAGALWELAEASHRRLVFDPAKVFIPELAAEICAIFDLDPFTCLASGALLICAPTPDAEAVNKALNAGGIRCDLIGTVEKGKADVVMIKDGKGSHLPRPERDAIGTLFQ